jgi:hypothetical protein
MATSHQLFRQSCNILIALAHVLTRIQLQLDVLQCAFGILQRFGRNPNESLASMQQMSHLSAWTHLDTVSPHSHSQWFNKYALTTPLKALHDIQFHQQLESLSTSLTTTCVIRSTWLKSWR